MDNQNSTQSEQISVARTGNVPSKSSVVLNIILSIITFGIWGLVWFFKLASRLAWLRPQDKIKPFLDFLLSLITLGIYGIYIMYKYPHSLYKAEKEFDPDASDISTMSIILTILGLGIIPWCIMQSKVNSILDRIAP